MAGGDIVLTSCACVWSSPHIDGALVHAFDTETSRAKCSNGRDRLTPRKDVV